VRAAQTAIVARLATARARIQFMAPNFRYVHFDVGDYVGYSCDWLFDRMGRRLRNQIGLVEELGIGLDGPDHEIIVRDTGAFITDAGLRDVKDYAG